VRLREPDQPLGLDRDLLEVEPGVGAAVDLVDPGGELGDGLGGREEDPAVGGRPVDERLEVLLLVLERVFVTAAAE